MAAMEGKVAAITGGAGGIGRALAAEIVRQGGAVILSDRDGDALAAAVAEMGDEALGIECDVAELASVEEFAAEAFAWRGRIDVLINNAGVSGARGRLAEVDIAEARRIFDINFWGVWHCCKAFAPRLAGQDGESAIYNVASENALFAAVPQIGAYIASKHAVLGMTESLREDLPGKVHVGTIFPGWVQSGLSPDAVRELAMPADAFARIVVPQILARERFVVSHAYNAERFGERTEAIDAAFAEFAPRYDGDDEYDVRTAIARLSGGSATDG